MKKYHILLLLLIFNVTNFLSQNRISSDSAIIIALERGLPIGLCEYGTKLEDDTIWIVKSLLCDEGFETLYDTKMINAFTGEIVKNRGFFYTAFVTPNGKTLEKTKNKY